MSLLIPFNNNPLSTTVRTGSYTIPAGNYAYVTVDLSAGGSFSIDGTTAVSAPSEQDDNVTAVSFSFGSYTVPSGYEFHGNGICYDESGTYQKQITVNSVVVLNIDSSASNDISRITSPIKAGPGEVIAISVGSGSAKAGVSGFSKRDNRRYNNLTANFWVPEDTDLSESGNVRYTVALYAKLG